MRKPTLCSVATADRASSTLTAELCTNANVKIGTNLAIFTVGGAESPVDSTVHNVISDYHLDGDAKHLDEWSLILERTHIHVNSPLFDICANTTNNVTLNPLALINIAWLKAITGENVLIKKVIITCYKAQLSEWALLGKRLRAGKSLVSWKMLRIFMWKPLNNHGNMRYWIINILRSCSFVCTSIFV